MLADSEDVHDGKAVITVPTRANMFGINFLNVNFSSGIRKCAATKEKRGTHG